MKTYLKDINFLPQRIILARKRRKNLYVFSVAFLLVACLIGWACWFPYHLASGYQQRLTSLNNELEELEPAKPYYEHLVKREDELKAKRDALTEIMEKQTNVLELLSAINSILPTNCYVSHLDIKLPEECTIAVVTHNPVETARVLVGLRSLGLFDKVSLSEVGEVPFTEGSEPVEFKLKFIGAKSTNQGEDRAQTGQNSDDKQNEKDSQKVSETDNEGVRSDREETRETLDIEETSEITNDSTNNSDNTNIEGNNNIIKDNTNTNNKENNNIIKEGTTDQSDMSSYKIDFDKDLEPQLKQMEKELLEQELNPVMKQ